MFPQKLVYCQASGEFYYNYYFVICPNLYLCCWCIFHNGCEYKVVISMFLCTYKMIKTLYRLDGVDQEHCFQSGLCTYYKKMGNKN